MKIKYLSTDTPVYPDDPSFDLFAVDIIDNGSLIISLYGDGHGASIEIKPGEVFDYVIYNED